MKARGAFVVDLTWKASQLEQAEIISLKGAACMIKTDGPVKVTHQGKVVDVTRHADGKVSFPTVSGGLYRIEAR